MNDTNVINNRTYNQGSALGPLLFLVYMNSLPSQVTQGLLLQYADDTTLICSGSTPDVVATTVSIQLSYIQSWIDRSRMKLNFTKSCVLWFSVKATRQPTYPPLLLLTIQFYVWLLNRNILVWFLIVSSLGALMFLVYVRRCHTVFIY